MSGPKGELPGSPPRQTQASPPAPPPPTRGAAATGEPGLTAEIYRSGRWRWTIRIVHNWCVLGDPMYGPPTALGRKRAERKARRIMAKMTRDDARRQERYPVRIDGCQQGESDV